MKIYKVNLDPSNPIQQTLNIPHGEDWGIQVEWDNDKYPYIPGTDVEMNDLKLSFTAVYKTNRGGIWYIYGKEELYSKPGSNVYIPSLFKDMLRPKTFDNVKDFYCYFIFGNGSLSDGARNKFASKVILNFYYDDKVEAGINPYKSINEDNTQHTLDIDTFNFKVHSSQIMNNTIQLNGHSIRLNGGSIYNNGASINNTVDSNKLIINKNGTSITGPLTINGTNICDIGGASYEGISESDGRIEICSNTIYMAGSNVDLNGTTVLVNGNNVLVSTGDNSNFIGYCASDQAMYVGMNLCDWSKTEKLHIEANQFICITSGIIELGGYDGSPITLNINGTAICLTKFLADYGMTE